jgi:hypothetical protein
MSFSDKDVSNQKVQEKIHELRTNYALFAAILELIQNMDLKEITIAMFAIDGMESLLKIRALLILGSCLFLLTYVYCDGLDNSVLVVLK